MVVGLGIEHGSHVLVDRLTATIRKQGSTRLCGASLKMVENAARLAVA